MAGNSNQLAIPLVLPNNCTWNERTGKYDEKKGVERKTLGVMQEALDQLSKIKEHVCVVSIAGPYRKGKSYILSKVFDQGEVFPLGHALDPETMGIWLWVVPQKFQDSTGRDFTVVLLDSEGVDFPGTQQTDDHRIFTLSVLLSSILIYNSAGVPNRSDLEGLDFVVKLSERIQLYAEQKSERDRDEAFSKTFPNFIWLLRDKTLGLSSEYSNIKEYILEKILNAKGALAGSNEKTLKAADSILNFFSGFDAFSLPSPSVDPQVMQNLNDKAKESQVNPKFLEGVQQLKAVLNTKLAPKKSINEGEFVTGEALAEMVQIYVDALNTPGTVPIVQKAWDTFVSNKCTKTTNDALKQYKEEMTSRVRDKIPCTADEIRTAHEITLTACLERFHRETFALLSQSVDKYITEFMDSVSSILENWIQENRHRTEVQCRNLLEELKEIHLSPVLARLGGPEAAKMEFKDLVEAYNKVEEEYQLHACGAKDVQATVFMNFIPELRDEMQKNVDVLKRMKDYDEKVERERERVENIVAEEQQRRFEELRARWEEERQNLEKQMEILKEKQKEDIERLKQMADTRDREQKEQIKYMHRANFEERKRERIKAMQKERHHENRLEKLKKIYDDKLAQKQKIDSKIKESSNPCVMDILVPIASAIIRIISLLGSQCSVM